MFKALHDSILYADSIAWYYLNTQWRCAFLDLVTPFLRNQWTWAPLYLFLAIFMPARYRRSGWIWCIAFLVSFILSDQISATFLKPYFHRVRPCNNPFLAGIVHNIVPCGGGLSFPSSHAANHFSIGIFGAMTLGKAYRWVWPVSIIWAISVCYSQVYVGVHYPLDVLCGGLLGAAIGTFTGRLYNKYVGLEPKVPIAAAD